MRKVIILLIILIMSGIVIAADLPDGFTKNPDGSILDTYSRRYTPVTSGEYTGYYQATMTSGDTSYTLRYNPTTNTRMTYDSTNKETEIWDYNKNARVTSSGGSFAAEKAKFEQQKTVTPPPASASSPTRRQPVTSDEPVAIDGTTPTPSPTPTPAAGTEQKYGVTLGNLLKTQAGTYTPRSDNNYERNTYDDQGNLETREVYYPETRTSVVYKITKGGVGESEAVSVKQFDENYGYVEYDRNQPAEMSRILVANAGGSAPGPAEATGENPQVVIKGGAGPEEEKVAEEAEEKKPKKTIIVEGGKEEEAAGTKEEGATKYYVDSDNNVYTTDTNKPYDKDDKEVPETIANAAKTYGKITSVQGNTYTFKEQVSTDDGIEADYRTTTEVSITANDDGTYERTVDQKTEERTGLLERGEWKYVDRNTVTTSVGKTQDKEKKEVKYMESRSFTTYDNKGENAVLTEKVDYKYSERWGKVYQTGATVYDGDNNKRWDINEKGVETYYNDKGEKVSQSDAKLTGAERKAIDKASVRYVNSGAAGWNAWHILGTARSVGRFMRAYDEYAGLRQYSAIGLGDYDAQVKERKAKIQQEFCIASGTRNCIVSTICSKKFDIVPGNTLAGRGPGGAFVTSARINAERSLSVEFEGMTRQQLIDMFGNTTVISGRRVNLTDPAFDTKALGKIKLKLYHVQFTITNNANNELKYQLSFRRGEPGSTTSYGTPVKEAKWYPAEPKIAVGATGSDEVYKWSPGEYSDVCLTFSPPLPSGSVTGKPQMVNYFCVPFTEYTGGPTEIAASLEEALAQGEQEEQVTGTPGEMV